MTTLESIPRARGARRPGRLPTRDVLPPLRSLMDRCMAGELTRAEPSGGARPDPSLPVGAVLADRYEVVGLLGRGGFGVVYRARDRVLRRCVAIKELRLEPAGRSGPAPRLERIRREAIAIAGIRHEGVIRLSDVLHEAERFLLVMEYFRGRTLRSLLTDGGAFSRATALRLCGDAARALGAVHAAGVVHRDVKPENLMVSPRGDLKLVDFGSALLLGCRRLTLSGTAPLTPRYCAPERLTGARVTPAADTYALGCVLAELVTGRPPHDRAGTPEVLARVLAGEPMACLAQLQAEHPDVAALAAACVRPDPERRPRMDEVAARLGALARGATGTAAGDAP